MAPPKASMALRSLTAVASWTFFFGALLLLVCQRLGYYDATAVAAKAASSTRPHIASGGAAPSLVLPPTYGGVYHYRVPGAFDPVNPEDTEPVAGTLHLYLKMARWPADGHLRAKGFVVFEFARMPQLWMQRKPPVTSTALRNVPEVFRRLRMAVRSQSRGWKRELALHTNFDPCESKSSADDFDYAGCVAAARNETQVSYNFPDISLDFGLADGAPTDIEIYAIGWPRRVSLTAQIERAVAAPEPDPADVPDADAPPSLVITLPYFKHTDATKAAQLLKWNQEYHEPLGFKGAVMYVLPKDEEAVSSHPDMRALVSSGKLTLVLWDELIPVDGWQSYDLRVVQSHGVLSQWGRNVRVLVADFDEFLVPAAAKQTLPRMLSGSGCLANLTSKCAYFTRRNVFPHNGFGAGSKASEPALWDGAAVGHPLLHYRYFAPHEFPKALVDPNHVFPMSVHWTSSCVSSSSVANARTGKTRLRSECGVFTHCTWVPPECGWIAHVANMYADRHTPLNAPLIEPENWLWMLQKS